MQRAPLLLACAFGWPLGFHRPGYCSVTTLQRDGEPGMTAGHGRGQGWARQGMTARDPAPETPKHTLARPFACPPTACPSIHRPSRPLISQLPRLVASCHRGTTARALPHTALPSVAEDNAAGKNRVAQRMPAGLVQQQAGCGSVLKRAGSGCSSPRCNPAWTRRVLIPC